MHFWIDKRSQTCGFSGRHRVPSSISTGGFGGRHRHRGGGAVGTGGLGVSALGLGLCSSSSAARNHNYYPHQAHVKLMVTPVHRFQSIECVAGNAGRYHQHGSHYRSSSHHHHPRQTTSSTSHHHISSPSNYNNNNHHQNANRSDGQNQTSNNLDIDTNNSGNFLELPSTIDDGIHHRSSALSDQHHHNMVLPAAGKLKCGMWASFAIVTVFMVGAKFYFNNQSTGMEVLIFCSLLVVVLFAGCTVSLCEAVTSAPSQPIPAPLIIDSTANRLSPPSTQNRTSTEDLQHTIPQNNQVNNNGATSSATTPLITTATTNISGLDQPQPPPPYHIAVLLPQHQPNNNQHHIVIVDDSPPPSYDKVVIS